jgi:hypothetical protein
VSNIDFISDYSKRLTPPITRRPEQMPKMKSLVSAVGCIGLFGCAVGEGRASRDPRTTQRRTSRDALTQDKTKRGPRVTGERPIEKEPRAVAIRESPSWI